MSRFVFKYAIVLWAVSSPKCKKRSMMLPEIESVWCEQLGRALETERLAWPGVQFPGNGIQLFLGVATQVAALGKVLPQQAVGVLVDASRPGTVRIGEVARHPRGFSQPLMRRHFPALIVRQRQPFLPLNPIAHLTKSAQCYFGAGVVPPGQYGEQGGPLHPCTDGRAVQGPLDEIAFPMPRHQPVFNFRRAVMHADPIWDLSPPVFATRPRADRKSTRLELQSPC